MPKLYELIMALTVWQAFGKIHHCNKAVVEDVQVVGGALDKANFNDDLDNVDNFGLELVRTV